MGGGEGEGDEAAMKLRAFLLICLVLLPAFASGDPYCTQLHVPPPAPPATKPKPYLGITYAAQKPEKPAPPCTDGSLARVENVMKGAPAEKAGIRENDLLLTVNDKPVCQDRDASTAFFGRMIAEHAIGEEITLELLRGAEKVSVTVKLAAMPTRRQPEADHSDLENCPDSVSLLAGALRAQGLLPLFTSILNGLYRVSNTVHNPTLDTAEEPDPLQLQETTWLLRHPLSAGEVAKQLSRRVTAPLHEENWRLGDALRESARLLDQELPPLPPADATFPGLLRTMEETKSKVEHILSRLSPEEQALLRQKAISPWEDSRWDSILAISRKIDRRELFSAFLPLLSYLSRNNLALLKEDLIKRFGNNKGPILFEADTSIGKVIVGGPGPNVYREDAALILDLGGDDLYLNNAGGTRPGIPVALVIDWGGNDTYIAQDNFSQGAGVLGGGFLVDLGGNDTFVALDGSQGGGFWGVGLLYHGDGKGLFRARSFSQGTGEMGIGLLVNGTGDTAYSCLLAGQGLGLFGGAGILVDQGGNDLYQLGGSQPDFRDPQKATVSLGQGFGKGIMPRKGVTGVPGGIGMLIDEAGDDTYIADYFAQGASYYYGVGILLDAAGNDRYLAGRYAQGAGIHSSVGVLIDREGNDSYYASFGVAQGMGHDYGVGLFEDNRGDDSYRGGQLVQGAATNGGLGIFLGRAGKERYLCNEKGGGYAEERDAMGILITVADEPATGRKGTAEVRVGVKDHP